MVIKLRYDRRYGLYEHMSEIPALNFLWHSSNSACQKERENQTASAARAADVLRVIWFI